MTSLSLGPRLENLELMASNYGPSRPEYLAWDLGPHQAQTLTHGAYIFKFFLLYSYYNYIIYYGLGGYLAKLGISCKQVQEIESWKITIHSVN